MEMCGEGRHYNVCQEDTFEMFGMTSELYFIQKMKYSLLKCVYS